MSKTLAAASVLSVSSLGCGIVGGAANPDDSLVDTSSLLVLLIEWSESTGGMRPIVWLLLLLLLLRGLKKVAAAFVTYAFRPRDGGMA